MRGKLIKSIVLVTVISLLFITVSFAWFTTFNARDDELIITSGDLKLSIVDFKRANFSTVKDNITVDNYQNEELWVEGPASLSDFNTSVCVPGENYLFKIRVKNTGDVNGYLSTSMYDLLATGGLSNSFYSLGYFNDEVITLLENTEEELNKTRDIMSEDNWENEEFYLTKNNLVRPNQEVDIYFVIYFHPNASNYENNDTFNIGKIKLVLNQIAL